MADINAEEGPTTRVVEVLYCGHCSVPPEYCEFGTAIAECKAWLKTHDQNLFVKLYGETELVQAQVSTLDISCQEPAAVPSKSSKKTTPKMWILKRLQNRWLPSLHAVHQFLKMLKV
ncbi:translation machinery-associated protein 22 [Batrachochytrium dendrobatidis JEL423]|uniref:Translation machinery-associated protein 22 n=1 Tax=Batrachochytrium dendrobatidis (strain JEL423) TaxID=403673 RepID=A0A177WG23_BATDL|nr:translation machinery-associated protein 22 [Batrachochytrium dendrobatidis JEL423]